MGRFSIIINEWVWAIRKFWLRKESFFFFVSLSINVVVVGPLLINVAKVLLLLLRIFLVLWWWWIVNFGNYLMKICSWLRNRNSVKLFIAVIESNDESNVWFVLFDHKRFGPNTMAKFDAVILLNSEWSITLTKNSMIYLSSCNINQIE